MKRKCENRRTLVRGNSSGIMATDKHLWNSVTVVNEYESLSSNAFNNGKGLLRGGGGSLLPCSLPKLPYVPMFPYVFLICSPCNNSAHHVFVV